MVPIHDTDIAEERWSKSEWEHYELWEKVEHRLRRRKWLWISGTALAFLALSSVPTVLDRWPKWRSMSLARGLAQEVDRIKREAATQHASFRIRFADGGGLAYTVEKVARCSSGQGEAVRQGTIGGERGEGFALLSPEQGARHDVPGLLTSFCYDHLAGNEAGDSLRAFGIVAAKDLAAAEPRLDRLSVLLLRGASAEISFE
jgi:hypothetical protein